ncbi:Gfo/Idh/MocA family protein [Marinivivus vitaminiproducens]|uniref:Gfo/Idh/MocA family protein n=1 Tax=Marinivivus vitaminiproducens TaxID=3035935 RepID=UPI0027A1C93E|nr:Gfo/Idh/MocA family oxidoreductase [Geminicoccaceae bacterium SCSIO 64248]
MMELKGGLIGCGFFAENHLNAWRDLDGVAITAVCDRDRAKADDAARRFGIAAVYDDAAGMLAAEKLDFVDIATTVESHRALVTLAAANGVAAICQKPFAIDEADARAMVDACAEAGVPLMVHENFRWQRPILAAKAALDQGRIGEPFYARITFRHGHDIYTNQPYLRTVPRLAIQDLGIHLLDVARFLFGEVERVYCRTQRISPDVAGEDAATIVLDHANGMRCIVDCCFATTLHPDPFPQTWLRIEGCTGTIAIDKDYRVSVSGNGERDEASAEPDLPGWGAVPWHLIQDSVIAIQRHWVECLREKRAPATSGADNLKTLALTFAAYDSAASGRAVTP